MSGGVIQLVATGIQDVHLTGNPEISFFRSTFKRYTQFAMSNEVQLIQGQAVAGGVSTIRFEKKGDLLSYAYLMIKDNGPTNAGGIQPPNGAGTTQTGGGSYTWGSIIDRIELLIGGQVIDTQDVFFSNTIAPSFLSSNYSNKMVAGQSGYFLPLKFFFCTDFQSALPLIALQYHDVELRITWASGYNVTAATMGGGTGGTNVPVPEYRLFANYIYLDTDERKYFAERPLDMLIWQVQRVVAQPIYNQEMVFNHPVKFIAFPCPIYTNALVSGTPISSTQTLKLQINGVDIGIDKPLVHYSQVNPYFHTTFGYDPALSAVPVALVPFCLDTSKLQPTGTINFSRIDTFRLITNPRNTIGGPVTILTLPTTIPCNMVDTTRSQYIYAVNYNVLKIAKGMGGLLYSS